jgi:riboflavin kinase/FMN adenylyltransferase
MKTYRNIAKIKNIKYPTAVTLGVFDGLHLGHRKILSNLESYANIHKFKSLVVTFEPHPEKIWGKSAIKYLNSLEDRLKMISDMGIDYALIINFTPAFASLEPEEFVKKVLLKKLNMKMLITSSDYKFGYKAKGDIKLLRRLSKDFSFKLKIIKPLKRNGAKVNSTHIRKLLQLAKIEQANRLLGRRYFIRGRLVQGKRLGSKIGFPTINLKENPPVILPVGVYLVLVEAGAKSYKGVANIGYRPTVESRASKNIEIHLLSYRGYFRAKKVKVSFIKYLRSESKFNNIDELKKAIARDIKKAKKLAKKL